MPDPGTSTAITLGTGASIGIASIVLGINPDAAIGAFAGATLFITSARELSIGTRFTYLLISIVMGYYLAGEIQSHTGIAAPAVAGFIGGLSAISIGLLIIKHLQESNLRELLRGRNDRM
jgi:hypothetical protein